MKLSPYQRERVSSLLEALTVQLAVSCSQDAALFASPDGEARAGAVDMMQRVQRMGCASLDWTSPALRGALRQLNITTNAPALDAWLRRPVSAQISLGV